MCIATSLLLTVVVIRYRYLFLKPSMIVIACFHIQVQWAATIEAGFIEQYLPAPYPFLLLSQVFPLLGLIASFFILHRRTVRVYSRITGTRLPDLEVKARSLVLLLGAVVLILLFYLTVVPLSRTGIYAILLDPLRATLARESSLKLLESDLLKYLFSILKAALAPMLCVLAAVHFVRSVKRKKVAASLAAAYIILFTMAVVSLPGARMPAAMLVVTVLFAVFAAYKMPLRPTYVLLSFILTLSLPVLFTIFREGQAFDFVIFFEYMKGGVLRRVFYVPMETGLWHVHYGQVWGFVGAAGIPKLAGVLAIEPLNLANLIYLKYSPYFISSGLCNTSYVFAYYTCFGIGSLVFSFLGLWGLDLAVIVLDRLRNNAILLAASASLVTSSIWFVSTMYTTALISNGFIFILIFAVVLDRLSAFSLVSKDRKIPLYTR
jgi:hypothetical protein